MMRTKILEKITVAGLAAAILMSAGCGNKNENRTKAPIRVKTIIVHQLPANNAQTYVGIVEENEGTALSFTGMGVVKRMLVSEGQSVSQGQLIAEMDETQARNLLSGAEAAMAQANDALQRYGILHDNGSLTEVQWVDIQSKVAQAKSQLEVAKKNLADCRLVAPVSGIIGKKLVGTGETAMPSQAVVTILDISHVKVKVAIPEAEISSIHTDTPSTISVEAIGAHTNGGHIEKGIEADALTHTYDVRITTDNNDRKLLPGMVANVQFAVNDSQTIGSKSLPVTAVQKTADGSHFVWTVANDSTAHRTIVTIGGVQGNDVGIADGIEIGQRIVTEGYQKLSEGTKVVF